MRFRKGRSGNPRGRPRGSRNKLSGAVKEMILAALDSVVGGQAYLEQQARENPKAFLTLLGRILPLQMAAEPEQPRMIQVNWPPSSPEGRLPAARRTQDSWSCR